jgi:hypothetical protein
MKLCVSFHWTNGQEMADSPHTGDMSRRMTFPWPAAHNSIACETSHHSVKHREVPPTFRIHHRVNFAVRADAVEAEYRRTLKRDQHGARFFLHRRQYERPSTSALRNSDKDCKILADHRHITFVAVPKRSTIL